MDAMPPSMAFEPRQTSLMVEVTARLRAGFAAVERWLEKEREQVPLWAPIALGVGIAAWFALPHRMAWLAFCCGALALGCVGVLLPEGARLRRMMVAGGVLACMGCVLIWGKALLLGEPPLSEKSKEKEPCGVKREEKNVLWAMGEIMTRVANGGRVQMGHGREDEL